MRVLKIAYSLWKQIVQANGFSTFHQPDGTEAVLVWAGHPEIVYSSEVDPDDYSDWNSTFGGTSTQVANEDGGLANIAGLGKPLQPRSTDGSPIVATQLLQLGQEKFIRQGDGLEQMNVNGSVQGNDIFVYQGGTDGGGNDWTVSGVGSETAGAAQSGSEGWDTGLTLVGSVLDFESGSDQDIVGTYQTISFWINPQIIPPLSQLRVRWRTQAGANEGAALRVDQYTTNMDIGVWQRVEIPIADFGLTTDVATLRFRFQNVVGQQFYFDNISLNDGVSNGPYRYQLIAPAGDCYHVSMIVLIVAAPSTGWASSNFANISALSNGLILRQRRLSDGEILWVFNSKDNIDLFGRYHPQDVVDFAGGDKLAGFMIKPGKSSVLVTDDEILEFVVRDDLSSLTGTRAFAHYGIEKLS